MKNRQLRNNILPVATLLVSSIMAIDDVRAQGIEEIVVTATKRAENINDVPIAIVAQTGEMLAKAGISSSDDLSLLVPGLHMSRSSNQAINYLRGVGTSIASAGNEPSVAMYIDDVYNPSPNTGIMSFNNVERIEVLKGPQGTLFGRNATGGLIHVITKKPDQAPAMDVSVGYGNYEDLETKVYATGGVTEDLATDLAIFYRTQGEGYVKNSFLNNETSKEDRNISLRNKWLYQASDQTSIEVTGNYAKLNSSLGMAAQPLPGTVHLVGTTYSGDWHTLAVDQDAETLDETWGVSMRVDHSFSEIDFSSITSYNDIDIEYLVDQEGSPVDLISPPVEQGQKYFSQEFRFSGESDNLKWLTGLYYFSNESSYEPLTIAGLGIAPLEAIDVFSTTDLTSVSAFGEMTWNLTEKLGLILGGRWTEDKLEQAGHTEYVPLPPEFQPPAFQQDVTFREPTWRLGFNYQATEETMYYGTYSRGFKSGGYNSVTTGGVGEPPVEPEILDAYELGIKTDLLDGLAHMDAAAFYYSYDDLQVTTIIPGGNRNLNAAQSTIRGAEFSFTVVPTDALTVTGGMTYLDTEYDEFPNGPVFIPLPGGGNNSIAGDLSGNQLVHSPELTGNLMVLYSIPMETGMIDMSVNYYYNDGFEWNPDGSAFEPSYGLVSAELGWLSLDEKYGVKLWGKNLTDEEYTLFTFTSVFGTVYAPAPPRTYGVTFSVSL